VQDKLYGTCKAHEEFSFLRSASRRMSRWFSWGGRSAILRSLVGNPPSLLTFFKDRKTVRQGRTGSVCNTSLY